MPENVTSWPTLLLELESLELCNRKAYKHQCPITELHLCLYEFISIFSLLRLVHYSFSSMDAFFPGIF